MSRSSLVALAVGAGAALAWRAAHSWHAFTRTEPYSVRRRDGDVEIRDYPARVVATTRLDPGSRTGAFRRLFDFIRRGNGSRRRIAMTAPVLIERGTMAFVMPAEIAHEGAPRPNAVDVRVDRRPAQRVAVQRFDGRPSAENERRAVGRLRQWLHAHRIPADDAPVVAYYDAPWVPARLRRNEVMLPIHTA